MDSSYSGISRIPLTGHKQDRRRWTQIALAALLILGTGLLSPIAQAQGSLGKIAFVSNVSNGFWHINIMNADGTNQRRVTAMGAPYLLYPHFSPDSNKIAFMADRSGNGDREIYIVNA